MGNKAFYGREPFDLKLTALRLVRSLGMLAAITMAGIIIFGGGYFVKNVLLRPRTQYRATSNYYIEYAVEEEKDVSVVHINETSWNTYVDTGEFLDAVRRYLPDTVAMPDGELAEALGAVLASDLRVVSTTVTTEDPELSLAIAAAVENVMTRDFPRGNREVTSIRLIDPARETEEVLPDVRPVRAFVLSGILSFFFAVVVFLLKETGDDSIWLPVLLEKRYGLKTVGTLEDKQFWENMSYLFEGKENVAVCAVQRETGPDSVIEALRRKYDDAGEKGRYGLDLQHFHGVSSPLLDPQCVRNLRQTEGILLVLKAGRHAGKQLEYVKEYLERQDCHITAVLLWEPDEKLIRQYYALPAEKKARTK